MKTISFLICLLICSTAYCQDSRKQYWKYVDSMWMARNNRDTAKQNRYLDSMAKYCNIRVVKKTSYGLVKNN